MANYLCVYEGGSYITFLTEEGAVKRWALIVYQSRCQIFRLGEPMLTMVVTGEDLKVSWRTVSVD